MSGEITVAFTDAEYRRLRERARERGESIDRLVSEAIARRGHE